MDAASFLLNEAELQKTRVFAYYMDQSDLVRRIILMRGRYEAPAIPARNVKLSYTTIEVVRRGYTRADRPFLGIPFVRTRRIGCWEKPVSHSMEAQLGPERRRREREDMRHCRTGVT